MNDVSPESRKLLDGARMAGGPSAAQRIAMKQAVLAAAGAPSPVSAAAPVKSALLAKLGAGALVVAVGGAVLFKLAEPEVVATPDPAPMVQQSSPREVEESAPVPVVAEAPPPLPEPSRAPVVKKGPPAQVIAEAPPAPFPPPPPAPAPKVDEETLAREVAAVGAAMTTVQNGNYDQALADIDTYSDDFPGGALQVEASVVKVLALCGLKRVDEARALAATVPASNPAARRLERSCVK